MRLGDITTSKITSRNLGWCDWCHGTTLRSCGLRTPRPPGHSSSSSLGVLDFCLHACAVELLLKSSSRSRGHSCLSSSFQFLSSFPFPIPFLLLPPLSSCDWQITRYTPRKKRGRGRRKKEDLAERVWSTATLPPPHDYFLLDHLHTVCFLPSSKSLFRLQQASVPEEEEGRYTYYCLPNSHQVSRVGSERRGKRRTQTLPRCPLL